MSNISTGYSFTSARDRRITACKCDGSAGMDCDHCHGSRRMTFCNKCGKMYTFHNGYTPLQCPTCDPLAWLNPPEAEPRQRKQYDPLNPAEFDELEATNDSVN